VRNDNNNIPAHADITATLPKMIGFSLPALGLNMLVTAVFVFLPALYTEYRHLGAATVGTVFLLAKLVDFVAAPSWGLFMDSYSTRWGRRRPWLALSTPMLMLAILMLYNPPETVSVVYSFVWLSVLTSAGLLGPSAIRRGHWNCLETTTAAHALPGCCRSWLWWAES